MRFLTGLMMLAFITSCTIRDQKAASPAPVNPYATAQAYINEGEKLVQDGDLVVRSGQEFTSQFIKQFNRHDKSYSHSGIVFYENGYPYVYHIVTGDESPDGSMRRDSLSRFCNPRKNFGFAIYRYDLNGPETKTFEEEVKGWYQKKVCFDSSFNMKTDDRMYCSEMIKKSLAAATKNRIDIETTRTTPEEARFFSAHLHLDSAYLSKLDIVALDNLYLNPHCRLIKKFDFNLQP
jgi:hypothetical protein